MQQEIPFYYFWFHIEQWSPTFLAQGTSFVEDKFSTDLGGGDGFNFSHLAATHLQLRSLVPNKLWTGTSMWLGDCGP